MAEPFTETELEILASMVCERYDVLKDIGDDPKVTSESFKRGAREGCIQLASLNDKLRPHYVKGKYH